jgi:hypothetical protein
MGAGEGGGVVRVKDLEGAGKAVEGDEVFRGWICAKLGPAGLGGGDLGGTWDVGGWVI